MLINNHKGYRVLLLVIIALLLVPAVEGLGQGPGRRGERTLFGNTVNSKKMKVKEPRQVVRAKKKQEAKQRKLDKDYADFVKASRKRALAIQTPEVRERMKRNRKEADQQIKLKRKNSSASARNAFSRP